MSAILQTVRDVGITVDFVENRVIRRRRTEMFGDSGSGDSDSETQIPARADADRADRGVYDPHGADHDGYT